MEREVRKVKGKLQEENDRLKDRLVVAEESYADVCKQNLQLKEDRIVLLKILVLAAERKERYGISPTKMALDDIRRSDNIKKVNK